MIDFDFSVDSYLLSLHPSERDMQISHTLTTRGDWNDLLIGTVCHVMKSAPTDAYFVDVGAYVGKLAYISCFHLNNQSNKPGVTLLYSSSTNLTTIINILSNCNPLKYNDTRYGYVTKQILSDIDVPYHHS